MRYPASKDGLLFWEANDALLQFRCPPGTNIRMPLSNNEQGVLSRCSDTAAWSAMEEAWADGILRETGPGRWEMAADDVYSIDIEQRRSMGLPEPDPLNVHAATIGVPGHTGLGISVEVHHPHVGTLEGATKRNGPFYFTELYKPILVPRPVFELLELANAGPGGSSIEDHFTFLAKAQSLARKANARLDGYLDSEEYHFPDQAAISVEEHSPELIELKPRLNIPAGIPDVPASHLEHDHPPRVYSAADPQGRRHRIILGEQVRDQLRTIKKNSTVNGSKVPRFMENPQAFLPLGIDLEEFSKRVRGFKTVVYNSRPYLHIRPSEGGWFEGIPGIRLENSSGDSPEAQGSQPGCNPPAELSPETYRQLAEQARKSNDEYVRHGDGWIHIDHKAAESFLQTVDKLGGAEGGSFKIPARAVLDIYENLEALEFELPPVESLGLHRKLSEFPNPPLPSTFIGELLPHQLIGYRWLAHLEEKGAGGLLADEMGLGKTIQVIVHLARLLSEGRVCPSLIVCPKTLLENWSRELRRFLPSMEFTVFAGGGISALELEQRHLVLMSYDTLRVNQFEVGKVNWQFVACDEAQYAKNPTAQRTTAIKALKSNHRVALTGTPVENGMIEFWCIMDYVRPGLLGCWSDFRSGHERPLVEAGSEEERKLLVDELLNKLGAHYIRRMKHDILPDLPPKTDQHLEAGLSEDQLAIYRQIAFEGRTGGKGAALAAITKLLMLCAHPKALDHYAGPFEYQPGVCPKLDTTLQALREIRSLGQKALVFTRFLKVQQILQSAIRQEFGIWPDVLNGEITANRQQIVDIFSQRPGFNVLILSHDVGGIGLNITSANHVIHYTRPWNPAKENQGTDRSHRIGQKSNVTVYYPIVTDSRFETVEARLNRLLEGKQALARDVLRPTIEASVSAEDLMTCLNEVV